MGPHSSATSYTVYEGSEVGVYSSTGFAWSPGGGGARACPAPADGTGSSNEQDIDGNE